MSFLRGNFLKYESFQRKKCYHFYCDLGAWPCIHVNGEWLEVGVRVEKPVFHWYMWGLSLGLLRLQRLSFSRAVTCTVCAFTRLDCQTVQSAVLYGSAVLLDFQMSLQGVHSLLLVAVSLQLAYGSYIWASVIDAEPMDGSHSRLSLLAGNWRNVLRSPMTSAWQIQVSQAEWRLNNTPTQCSVFSLSLSVPHQWCLLT